jgi:hypothetical protein
VIHLKSARPSDWPAIEPILRDAIAHDGTATPETVRDQFETGESEALLIDGDAHGVIVLTIGTFDGVRCCWLNYVGGLAGPSLIRVAREVVAQIEPLARKLGCEELRAGGRNWSRVFPDWDRFDPDHPNRLRKRIANG